MNTTRYKRLAKEGGWIIVGQTATVLGTLVLVRVLTDYLDPAQYGQLALVLTIAGMLNAILMGGITSGIGRYYSIAAEKKDLPGYLYASGLLMSYVTAVVLFIATLLVTGILWLGYFQWVGLTAAVLVFSLLSAYNSTLNGIQNAARQRIIVAFHGGLDAWLKIILAIGVMHLLDHSSTSVVLGYGLSSLLVTISQFIFLRRLIGQHGIKAHNATRWVRQIWTYSWPFIIWGIFGWAQQSAGRWALEFYTTTTDVGLYTVLSQLGYSPVQRALGLAMTFLLPIFFARAGDASCVVRNAGVREMVFKVALLGSGITIITVLTTSFFHQYIFNILANEKYAVVSYLLPWMVLSGGIFAVAQVLASLLMTLNMTKKLLFASIVSSIIGILASIFCTYLFMLNGAIAASTIHSTSYLVLIVIVLHNVKRNTQQI